MTLRSAHSAALSTFTYKFMLRVKGRAAGLPGWIHPLPYRPDPRPAHAPTLHMSQLCIRSHLAYASALHTLPPCTRSSPTYALVLHRGASCKRSNSMSFATAPCNACLSGMPSQGGTRDNRDNRDNRAGPAIHRRKLYGRAGPAITRAERDALQLSTVVIMRSHAGLADQALKSPAGLY